MDRKEVLERIFREIELSRRKLSDSKRKAECFRTLTPVQWQLLGLLIESKKSTPSEMANKLGISRSAVSQIIDALQEKGFIRLEQEGSDRRNRFYAPTRKAHLLMEKIRKDFLERLENVFSSLSDEELILFLNLLSKLNRTSKV